MVPDEIVQSSDCKSSRLQNSNSCYIYDGASYSGKPLYSKSRDLTAICLCVYYISKEKLTYSLWMMFCRIKCISYVNVIFSNVKQCNDSMQQLQSLDKILLSSVSRLCYQSIFECFSGPALCAFQRQNIKALMARKNACWLQLSGKLSAL